MISLFESISISFCPPLEISLSFVPEVDMNRQRDCRTRVSIEPQGRVRFSVFISYAEIYNELIYDLLEKPPLMKHMRRTALKLAEDKSKQHHIKGEYICVL